MVSPLLAHGSILKCAFPFDDAPAQPGPSPHYCLYIDHFTMGNGQLLVSCIYGTSKLDKALINHNHGMIMSVDVQQHINVTQGRLAGPTIHFVCDHVALIPCDQDWFYDGFQASLKFTDTSDLNIRQREKANDLAYALRTGRREAILSAKHTVATVCLA